MLKNSYCRCRWSEGAVQTAREGGVLKGGIFYDQPDEADTANTCHTYAPNSHSETGLKIETEELSTATMQKALTVLTPLLLLLTMPTNLPSASTTGKRLIRFCSQVGHSTAGV